MPRNILKYVRSGPLRGSSRAFTLVEVLVTIVITVTLAVLGLNTFSSILNYQAVDKDADTGLSYLEKARTLTINSSNNSSYGVQFATTSMLVFQGMAATSSNQIMVYNLNGKVKISAISFSNGTSSLYFSRITGEPSATGTVTFSSSSGASTTKQITIYGTGLAEVK